MRQVGMAFCGVSPETKVYRDKDFPRSRSDFRKKRIQRVGKGQARRMHRSQHTEITESELGHLPSGVAFQPVETDEVAARLVELALEQPSGLVPDIAGPRVYSMAELIRGYLERTHRRRLLLPLGLPGKAAGALRAGANLAPEHAVGTRTWEQFLADRLSQSEQPH
jgi:hypothetical protein